MFLLNTLNKILICIFVILMFTHCSSSSVSQRYNKEEDEEESRPTKSVRFTSEDDETAIFRNIPEDSEFDEEPVEDYPVDTEQFIKNYKHLGKLEAALTRREKMLFEVVKYLDTPYQYGGNSLTGIDCSAFTQSVFNNAVSVQLPRTASQQFNSGDSVRERNLEFGDLIFFDTRKGTYPGHVGLYLGEDLFAHASQSQGVTISSLKSSYYKNRFVGARRVENINGE